MTRVVYAIYLGIIAVILSFTDLSYIERSLCLLVAVCILGLFQLVSVNEKLNKWK